jgi:nucleoside-specific outer membrane channel protein Tsx
VTSSVFRFVLSVLCVLSMFSSRANAGDFIEWQSANIQLLRGWDYEVGKTQRTLVTLEYANKWRYGDLFIFVDGTRFDGGEKTAFGEISPRFSFGKILGQDLSYGIVKDVLLATTFEKGESKTEAFLIGLGLDLDLPGFTFFNANIYRRHDPQINDDIWQLTLAWKYPFRLFNTSFVTEGFSDIAGNAGPTYHSNQFIVPRLLVNTGSLLHGEDNQLWVGVEYSYWRNKFGIEGVDESQPQVQMKWIF